jgi:hypothetical protein
MIYDIVLVGFTYIFMNIAEWAIHRASHYKESGSLYLWHKLHHIDYPVTRLESDVYIDSSSTKDNIFLRYIILVLVVVWSVSTLRTFLVVFIEVSLYSLLVDYFHKQLHLKDSTFKNYKLFQYYKRNHFNHHIKQNTNYGFFPLNNM